MPDPSPTKGRLFEPSISPGQLYKSIKIEERDFEKGETKLVKQTTPRFVEYCRFASRYVKPSQNAAYNPDYRAAIEFLGWDLKAGEFNSAVSFTILAGFLIAIIIGVLLMTIPFIPKCPGLASEDCVTVPVFQLIVDIVGADIMAMFYMFVPLLLIAVLAANFVQNYPLSKAREEQVRALTYVPEIVGYMTMSMKLVPNLERAVEFAAEHGRGKIAEDLKRVIWEVQLGFHNTLSEGLDLLAYRWGKFSDEFKRSLMMIRASVLEESESKRFALLDKTVTEMLESIRNKLENYARQLSQPSITLFYLGVLLPLILIIILPVGSVFSGAPLAQPEILILVYNIIIPIAAFLFARSVVRNRPPTYEPPEIPDSYPDLPPKNTALIGKTAIDIRFVMLIILVVGIGSAYFISNNGIPIGTDEDKPVYLIEPDNSEKSQLLLDGKPENYFAIGGPRDAELGLQYKNEDERLLHLVLEKQRFFAQNDVTPYKWVFGILLSLGAAVAVWLYFGNIYKRRVQLQTMQMESEFRESLYILASRMGENKPVEEALQHTREFLPNTLVAERIYGRTVENIHLLGMPLEAAVFDKSFGSLKNIPSNLIKSSMKLLVDSVSLGVNVSARTLMSLSMQLSNSEKVTHMLSVLIREVTSMMSTMAIFIAPVVLGVTTALQKVVMVTLTQVVESNTSQTASANSVNLPDLGSLSNFSSANFFVQNPEVVQTMVTPVQFVLIVAFYVIELVFVMTYYNTKIEEDNDVLFKLNLATSLPVSILVFTVAVLVSNMVVGAFTA